MLRSSTTPDMKTLGVLESKWDPIRKKLVRRLVEEQDKVLRSYRCSYFAQKGGTRSKGGTGAIARPGNMSMGHVYLKTARADRGQVTKSRATVGIMEIGLFVFHSFLGFVRVVKFVVN